MLQINRRSATFIKHTLTLYVSGKILILHFVTCLFWPIKFGIFPITTQIWTYHPFYLEHQSKSISKVLGISVDLPKVTAQSMLVGVNFPSFRLSTYDWRSGGNCPFSYSTRVIINQNPYT